MDLQIVLIFIYEQPSLVFMNLWSMCSWDASNMIVEMSEPADTPELCCPMKILLQMPFIPLHGLCSATLPEPDFRNTSIMAISSTLSKLSFLRACSRTVPTQSSAGQECSPPVTAERLQQEGSHSASISAPRFVFFSLRHFQAERL